MKKIDNYFANKEISAFHFSENLKRIILRRKTLQMTNDFEKTLHPYKKNQFSERINLTKEENNSLLTNCEDVAK